MQSLNGGVRLARRLSFQTFQQLHLHNSTNNVHHHHQSRNRTLNGKAVTRGRSSSLGPISPMHAALSRTSCRRALGERLMRVLSPLTANNCCSQTQPSIASSSVQLPIITARHSATNSRWKLRQGKDSYARQAKVKGLKSRAAFKLLEVTSPFYQHVHPTTS